jgi:uncharacterized protein (DUF2249 family)
MASENVRELDVRAVEGEPFGPIMSALSELPADGTLVLLTSFEPVPLYDVLAERGYEHGTEQVDDDEYRVTIEPA